MTRAVRTALSKFAWQARFHDHVVRSADDLRRIRAYTVGNPAS